MCNLVEILNQFKDDITKVLDKRLDKLERKFNDMFKKLSKEKAVLEERLTSLETRSEELLKKNKFMEKKLLEKQLIINNIDCKGFDSCEAVITNTLKQKLNINLECTDIESCYKVGNGGRDNKSTIIVNLMRLSKKTEILSASRAARSSNRNINNPIYVNDSLTEDVRRIFGESRMLLREKKIAATWIWRREVYIRLINEDRDHKHHISGIQELYRACGVDGAISATRNR